LLESNYFLGGIYGRRLEGQKNPRVPSINLRNAIERRFCRYCIMEQARQEFRHQANL